MITLITGSPGAGKTLYMVSMLAKNKEFEGRRIFVDGIPDLKIDNVEPFPEGCGIHNLHEWVKDEDYQGAIFVVDEAQRFFPPRSGNTKAPELVEFLHVHRHYAIDLYLITQMPARIDKNVRDLVGAHYHIQKNRLGGRTKLYWDYCANNPRAEVRNAHASVYKMDKSVFNLYRSAVEHTKIKQPKTRWLWGLPLAVVVAVFSAMSAFNQLFGAGGVAPVSKVEKVQEKAGNVQELPVVDLGDARSSAISGAAEKVGNDVRNAVAGERGLSPEMFVPAIPEMVESKPIYDQVRQVKQYEYATACISGKSGCSCYTDQGTKVKEISNKLCLEYVKDGLPFNPYREPRQDNAVRSAPSVADGGGGGQVYALSGHDKLTLLPDYSKGPSAQ
jgi:zonula occludens toxin family protein|nr:MAG TPA: zonular occludens toxin [Inoviridae sp.]